MKKQKFLTLFSILALCICTLFIGVWAARTATVTTGGAITFSATGVHCEVSGSIINAGSISRSDLGSPITTTATLPTLLFDSQTPEGGTSTKVIEQGDLASWQDNNLTFKESGDPITLKIDIQNKSNRVIWVYVDDTATPANNLLKQVTGGNARKVTGNGNISIEITLEPVVKEISVSGGVRYDYTINLTTESEIGKADDANELIEYEILTEESGTTLGTAQVKGFKGEAQTTATIKPLIQIQKDGVYNIYVVTTIWGDVVYGNDGLVGSSAFMGDIENGIPNVLSNISLPDTLIEIQGFSFFFTCLTEINLPLSVKVIGDMAFTYNSYLQSINLSSVFESFGEAIFAACALTNIVLHEGMVTVPAYMFNPNSTLTSVTLPSTIKIIEKGAFKGCSALEEIIIPEGVETIEGYALGGCDALKSITLPQSLSKITDLVFWEDRNLENLTINNANINIEASAFSMCDSLSNIYFAGTVEQWTAIENASNIGLNNCTVHCSNGEYNS